MAEQIAHGTLLKLGDGATSESFTTVASLTSVSWSGSIDVIDASNHDSASNTREKLPGYLDPGSVSFSGHFDPADATHGEASGGIVDEHETRARSNWRFEFAEGSLFTADGFVSELTIDGPDGDMLQFSGTITFTGAYTWA